MVWLFSFFKQVTHTHPDGDEKTLVHEEQKTLGRIQMLKDLRDDVNFDQWVPPTMHHHRRRGDV